MSFPREFNGYRVVKRLGRGAFSEVVLVVDKDNNKYAAKIVDEIAIIQQGLNDHFQQELIITSKLKHPNIVECKEYFRVDRYMIIIMEYCPNGDLFNIILRNKRLSERETLRIGNCILDALKYLHERNIAHRDIKPENIVFDANPLF